MKTWKTGIVVWLIAALFFSAIVTVITFIVGWKQVTSHTNIRYQEMRTLDWIRDIRNGADNFRRDHQRFPKSFAEFRKEDHFNDRWITNEEGEPVDLWSHPLIYVLDDHNPRIISYGDDGKPGGEGFDRDLTSDDESIPYFSFCDFMNSYLAAPVFRNSLIAGGFALVVFLITVWPTQFTDGFNIPWFRMFATTAFTIIAAIMITSVQLSGH